jgi:hypothetical protein
VSKWEHRVWNALFLALMLLGVLKLERVIETTRALMPLWQSMPVTGKVVEEK